MTQQNEEENINEIIFWKYGNDSYHNYDSCIVGFYWRIHSKTDKHQLLGTQKSVSSGIWTEMSCLIEKEADAEMKQAYTEMLERCLMEPDNRIWYAVWNMELKNAPGTIVGDFCFKGLGKNGVVEIGYGLREEFRHQGYMVETVKVITECL